MKLSKNEKGLKRKFSKIKERDIAKHELIGLKAEIIDSKNKDNIGIKGQIIDETKNTITIEQNNKTKRLSKNNITLQIHNQKIKGTSLKGRPKERK